MSTDSIPPNKAKELYELFMRYLNSGGREEILQRMILLEARAESGESSGVILDEASKKAKEAVIKALKDWKERHHTEKGRDGGGGLYWHYNDSVDILERVLAGLRDIHVAGTHEKTVNEALLHDLDLVKKAWAGGLAGADSTNPDLVFRRTHKKCIEQIEAAIGATTSAPGVAK